MKLIEGSAWSRVRRYAYKGFIIIQTLRSHDSRNKTHRGYNWAIEGRGNAFSRASAKSIIDRLTEAPKETP